jgi:hypothetical protein
VSTGEGEQTPAAAEAGAKPRWGEGVAAGVVGGLVMTVWKMGEAAIAGAGAWRPPNLIATIALGPSANLDTFDAAAFAVGMTLHLLASIAMGLVYAAIAGRLLPRLPPAAELAAVIAYALLSWAVYQWLIMPWLAPTMNENTSPASLAVAHVVFALGFAAWWVPRTSRSKDLPNATGQRGDMA